MDEPKVPDRPNTGLESQDYLYYGNDIERINRFVFLVQRRRKSQRARTGGLFKHPERNRDERAISFDLARPLASLGGNGNGAGRPLNSLDDMVAEQGCSF